MEFRAMTRRLLATGLAVLLLAGAQAWAADAGDAQVQTTGNSANLEALKKLADEFIEKQAATKQASDKDASDDTKEGAHPAGPILFHLGNDEVIAPAKPAPKVAESAPISLRFEQSPITEVINTVLGEIAKVNYVIHQPIGGSITLSTNTPIPLDDVLVVVESAMQANGVLMVRDARGTYHIGRAEALKGIVSAPRRVGNGTLPAGYGTVIVPLQYIGVNEMVEILKPVAGADSFVRIDPLRNMLILAGTRNQVEGWLEMVATFDVNILKGMSVGVFPLEYITTKDVSSAIQLMATSMGVKQEAGGGLPGLGAIRVLPIERINSVLVVTPRAALLEQARVLIEKIDRPMFNDYESQLFVYKVQNGSAAQLAAVLSGVLGTGGGSTTTTKPTSGVAPGLSSTTGSSLGSSTTATTNSGTSTSSNTTAASSGTTSLGTALGVGSQSSGSSASSGSSGSGLQIKVMADERNNSLVIYGSAAEYRRIEASLRRLDVAQSQVLIEATIVEVTLTGALQYGLQWYFKNFDPNTIGSGQLSTTTTSSSSSSSSTTVSGGFSYILNNVSNKLGLTLNALASDNLLKVISSPSLMVLDNQTASIKVGTQQPVQTSTTNTANVGTTTSYEYKNTGVDLSVTPSINAGDIVSMTINQAVVDSGGKDSITGQSAFLQRQINTKVAVHSGETLVLGGLIKSNASSSSGGVPLLKDLPLIGALFSNVSKSTDKTELLLMITPRVIRSEAEASDVSAELRERMKTLKGLDQELKISIPDGGASKSLELVAP